MRSYAAFFKKELTEGGRSYKIPLLVLLFLAFGVMNPAIAKLTPWLLELLADSMAESGMIISATTVDVSASWIQFFKNIPMALIVFLLAYGTSFTSEYQSGTLVLVFTKGISRRCVAFAKSSVMLLLWTLGYWLCFAVTLGYNAYFWSHVMLPNLMPWCVYWWLFGVLTICATVFFSMIFNGFAGVAVSVGGFVLLSYLVGMVPIFSKWTPTSLMQGGAVGMGSVEPPLEYLGAALVAVLLSIAFLVAGLLLTDKKEL